MGRIAELKINPQAVWKILGPQQYSERPLTAITIRELLQNADDAVLATGRDDGAISFDYQEKNGWASLICKDNGSGMTEDIILDKFLCLGESEKASGATGGFGIAKSAIIGACDKWSIKTLDNFLSSDMIGKEPVSKVGYSEGTEITLEWDLNSGNKSLIPSASAIRRGVEFIVNSELNSNAIVTFNGNKKLDQTEYETKVIEDNKQFKLTLCKTNKEHDAKIYYRLNGLIQFFKDWDSSELFFIVDIKTDKSPQHSDYPLGPSRETIKYDIDKKIRDITERYRINKISGNRAFKEKVNEVKLYEGKTIGEGKNQHVNKHVYYSSIPSKFNTEQLTYGDGNPIDYEFIVRRVNSNAKIDIYAENNTKLLFIWAKLLELGAKAVLIDKVESFGIGYILDDGTKAERYTYNSRVFYLINPKFIPMSKPQEAIPKLIFMAAHELAHHFHSDHTEEFTVEECHIFFKIYEQFSEVKWVRKFMREGIY